MKLPEAKGSDVGGVTATVPPPPPPQPDKAAVKAAQAIVDLKLNLISNPLFLARHPSHRTGRWRAFGSVEIRLVSSIIVHSNSLDHFSGKPMDRLTITGYSTALFSTWIFIEEMRLLFDAGDGVMSGLMHKSGKIRHIAMSHADRDHVY